MKSLSTLLAESLKVSLEDNAQVEVNFNIDTDEDGAPVDDAIEGIPAPSEEDEPSEEETEMNDSEEETDAAEADMDQLQEAQDSLESIRIVLNKHSDERTLSRMGIGFYKIALESIVGKDILEEVGVPSFESREYSKHHSALIAMESHVALIQHVNTISMEANFNWLKKLRHQIAVFFKGEKALLKRAQGLHAIAQTSKNEQATNDNIDVNGAKGLKLPIILSRKWNDERQFLGYVKEFTALYNGMAEIKDGYADEFVDNMFPGSKQWPKSDNGKSTYPMFGIKLVRGELIEGFESTQVTQETTVPNLSPKVCEEVLIEVMNTLRKGRIVHENIGIMCDVLERVKKVDMSTSNTISQTGNTRETIVKGESSTVHTTETYPDGYVEMLKTLEDLLTLKNKVITEILNYVNYSLTDREFN